jgi:hypothetical protein
VRAKTLPNVESVRLVPGHLGRSTLKMVLLSLLPPYGHERSLEIIMPAIVQMQTSKDTLAPRFTNLNIGPISAVVLRLIGHVYRCAFETCRKRDLGMTVSTSLSPTSYTLSPFRNHVYPGTERD